MNPENDPTPAASAGTTRATRPPPDDALEALRARIAGRFDLVPSFFMLAREQPPIVGALFDMAEFAYFDSPLPPLFKERLFTYVSRFCAVPYCMARHCGFLLGRGNVSGQAGVAGLAVEQVLAMLHQPLPDAEARLRLLATLREVRDPLERWPEPGTPLDETLFFAAAVAFVAPVEHAALLHELARVLGAERYNYLTLFLAFIRFAHFWTETHPGLRIESDIDQLLVEQRALADWMAGYEDVVRGELGRQAREELRELELLRARTAALQMSEASLRREVQTQARAAEAAEAASRAKSNFMATVSHELRTPLNAILGYVDLLETGVAGQLGEQPAAYLARIRATAQHQQQIIEEILTFSRLEAGREAVAIAPVALSEIRDEIEAVIAPLAAKSGLTFTTDFAAAPESVLTDPRKLRQILLNLLGNAVKFTAAGHVSLTVRRSGDAVAFVVADSGPGIRPEDRERIFEPFTQLDDSMTREHGGSGLGLAITRRLVAALGGELRLESVVGRGATFTVTLPPRAPAA